MIGMNSIGGFLERYKNFVPPPLIAARAVRDAIQRTLGIEVREDSVHVSRGRASVGTSALEKTEILLNKEKILAQANTVLGDAIKEIR